MKELGPLYRICKLGRACLVGSFVEVGRIQYVGNSGRHVQDDRIPVFIFITFKEHGNGNELGADAGGHAILGTSSNHGEGESLALVSERAAEVRHGDDAILTQRQLDRVRHFAAIFKVCLSAGGLQKIVVNVGGQAGVAGQV